jgi:hypothetical protein
LTRAADDPILLVQRTSLAHPLRELRPEPHLGAFLPELRPSRHARGGRFFVYSAAIAAVADPVIASASPIASASISRLAWSKPGPGLYRAEVIWRQRSWPSATAVEMATLNSVDWFNNHRLFGPIGHIPPAEAEANYYAGSITWIWRHDSNETASGKPGTHQFKQTEPPLSCAGHPPSANRPPPAPPSIGAGTAQTAPPPGSPLVDPTWRRAPRSAVTNRKNQADP